MGRWLDALVNAEAITGEVVPQEIYDQLAFWAYEIFNNDTGMMANLNVNTFEWERYVICIILGRQCMPL